MVFAGDNSRLYYWHQTGWGAGNAGSDVCAYSIGGAALTKIACSDLGYPNLLRDPLDTPIFLLEDKGMLIAKNKVFDSDDLSRVIRELPEPIYTVSPAGDLAVGKNGIYEVNTGAKTESLSLEEARHVFFGGDGELYYIKDNILYRR